MPVGPRAASGWRSDIDLRLRMLGRLVRPADFQRLLASAPRARSTHFAAHHVAGWPELPSARPDRGDRQELSTETSMSCQQAVEESVGASGSGCWLGIAVPKRHAREATTRNLIRRQIRSVTRACEPALLQGLWLVRLRSAFDRRHFRSAASAALRAAARDELMALMQRACR
jgi:ribonuclease P protein component